MNTEYIGGRMKIDGCYQMKGEVLAYRPDEGEEIVYDDEYNTPLSKLLLTGGSGITREKVGHILDENGYYGRYKIHKAYKHGCLPLNNIRIKVDLIWSQTSYIWPYQGTYCLDFMRIDKAKEYTKLPGCTARALRYLYKAHVVSSSKLQKSGLCSAKEAETLCEILRNMNLTNTQIIDEAELIMPLHTLAIATDSELREVIDNLIIENI